MRKRLLKKLFKRIPLGMLIIDGDKMEIRLDYLIPKKYLLKPVLRYARRYCKNKHVMQYSCGDKKIYTNTLTFFNTGKPTRPKLSLPVKWGDTIDNLLLFTSIERRL